MDHHALEIIEHVAGGNPKRLKPGIGELIVAHGVLLWAITHRMHFSVNFDCEPTLQTGEIDHIPIARELSAKPQAIRARTQLLPENDFRQRQFSAELAREADVRVRRADGPMPNPRGFGPSTMLRMVPLPVPGRI